ncbi:DUF3467 domain-containing protein [Methanofollis fontis]|uniref:DUF3467 domain-containing protein n=1 Tax=Methanofollis fontis TaxID=2052832 RepID=A0A483CMP5_9EURY|nr:DUF3467 domain-containing protein [Methanofollis fontis]TAJ43882.1 DUF3467 domain-containing protein [Methanofollis fontis]
MDGEEKKGGKMVIDLREMYEYEPSDLVPDIGGTVYSNLAYVQATHRDVFIDFLQMPGVKRDGKMHVQGTRVYLSHAAAQKLAGALAGTVERVYSDGAMEHYRPEKAGEREVSTQVSRVTKERTV